jgi:hypothetical protein
MERQRGPKPLLKTAPEGLLRRGAGLNCLFGGLIFAGLGAFDYLSRICDAAFEKRPPWPYKPRAIFSKR